MSHLLPRSPLTFLFGHLVEHQILTRGYLSHRIVNGLDRRYVVFLHWDLLLGKQYRRRFYPLQPILHRLYLPLHCSGAKVNDGTKVVKRGLRHPLGGLTVCRYNDAQVMLVGVLIGGCCLVDSRFPHNSRIETGSCGTASAFHASQVVLTKTGRSSLSKGHALMRYAISFILSMLLFSKPPLINKGEEI